MFACASQPGSGRPRIGSCGGFRTRHTTMFSGFRIIDSGQPQTFARRVFVSGHRNLPRQLRFRVYSYHVVSADSPNEAMPRSHGPSGLQAPVLLHSTGTRLSRIASNGEEHESHEGDQSSDQQKKHNVGRKQTRRQQANQGDTGKGDWKGFVGVLGSIICR